MSVWLRERGRDEVEKIGVAISYREIAPNREKVEENRTVSAGVVGQGQVANSIQMHCKHDNVP